METLRARGSISSSPKKDKYNAISCWGRCMWGFLKNMVCFDEAKLFVTESRFIVAERYLYLPERLVSMHFRFYEYKRYLGLKPRGCSDVWVS